MTVQMVRHTEVTRPSTTPLTSSVLDHATVVEGEHFGLGNDQGLWPSYNCLDTLVPTSICPAPETVYKTFSFAEWQPGMTFAVYGGVQCNAVGLDIADQEAEVKRVFEANEGKGVEQALMLNRFVATDPDFTDLVGGDIEWDDAEDLTPAGKTVNLVTALALLEGYAAANYAGVPTIHMPRAASTVLEASGLIVWTGDKAFTKNGSKVAIGGGYDDPTTLASGKWDMWATGEVYVERSSQVIVRAWVSPGDGSGLGAGENQIKENSSIALVERMYRVAIDCFVVKATGTVWS